MTTINITENITFTATEDTINLYNECVRHIDELSRWQESAFEEHDWEDYCYYDEEIGVWYDRLLKLA